MDTIEGPRWWCISLQLVSCVTYSEVVFRLVRANVNRLPTSSTFSTEIRLPIFGAHIFCGPLFRRNPNKSHGKTMPDLGHTLVVSIRARFSASNQRRMSQVVSFLTFCCLFPAIASPSPTKKPRITPYHLQTSSNSWVIIEIYPCSNLYAS